MSSHPVCNTIMLTGVITCLVSVFLLGVDGRFVEPSEYPAICQARAWMLSTGFTLAFGAMFSKVWRVHRLTTKTKADQAKVRHGSLIFKNNNLTHLLPNFMAFRSEYGVRSMERCT